jgi:hypothetical protein
MRAAKLAGVEPFSGEIMSIKSAIVTPIVLTTLAACGEDKTPAPETASQPASAHTTTQTGLFQDDYTKEVDALSAQLEKDIKANEDALKRLRAAGKTFEEIEHLLKKTDEMMQVLDDNDKRRVSPVLLTPDEKKIVIIIDDQLLPEVRIFREAANDWKDATSTESSTAGVSAAGVTYERAKEKFRPSQELFQKQTPTVQQAILERLKGQLSSDLTNADASDALERLQQPVEPSRNR